MIFDFVFFCVRKNNWSKVNDKRSIGDNIEWASPPYPWTNGINGICERWVWCMYVPPNLSFWLHVPDPTFVLRKRTCDRNNPCISWLAALQSETERPGINNRHNMAAVSLFYQLQHLRYMCLKYVMSVSIQCFVIYSI